jgi:spore coat polysaccharide biosynthesis protein SpsF (cytidylyltransferase family)
VVPWIWRQTPLQGGARFTAKNIPAPEDMSEHRWTVDEASDFLFMRAIASELGAEGIIKAGYRDILHVLKTKPQIQALNREITRDAGYEKSLAKEATESP